MSSRCKTSKTVGGCPDFYVVKTPSGEMLDEDDGYYETISDAEEAVKNHAAECGNDLVYYTLFSCTHIPGKFVSEGVSFQED